MPEEQDFYHTALSEGRATAQQQQNPSHNHTTIPPARIAKNTNLFDIFPFEFEANKSPFLLSNAAANEQKVITAMYTEAEVLAICGIFNKCSEKAPAFEFEPEEKKPIIKTFMAFGSMSNWANKTKQEHFISHTKPETSGWNISYSKPEPRKQRPYIPLKFKDCHKKLSLMEACISPEEEYENHTCYYCKACHRERWGHLIKRSRKWDNTPCLTCGDMLPEECNWINVAMRGGVCDQTCQYALSISEKVKRGTPFNAAYNSALNKLYHYLHDAKMIFDLAMALINRATKKDVR
ncbi:hypothetical protein G9A89_006934 [Geosiphon pyriformis]|nr:hypothetical protein G9A89_006934 [Geosiphon pyriformis]